MNSHKIKKDMMELWKDTFHDSDSYIRLVFDAYFNEANICCRYEGDRLIAALLGVEYEFTAGRDATNGRYSGRSKGLYLCGLATRPEYRGKGIMSELMKQVEEKATLREFDFTFLIPANDNLREFYRKKGYYDGSFKKKITVAGKTDSIKNNIHFIKGLAHEEGFMRELALCCHEIESSSTRPSIVHSIEDFLLVMRENENSFFLTDDSFDLKYPILAKVNSIVFPGSLTDDGMQIINGLFIRNSTDNKNWIVNDRLPDEIASTLKSMYPDRRVCCSHETIPKNYHSCTFSNRDTKIHESPKEAVCKIEIPPDEFESIEPYAMIKMMRQSKKDSRSVNSMYNISLLLD